MGSKSITLNVNVNALALAVCGYVMYKLRKENRELREKLKERERRFGG